MGLAAALLRRRPRHGCAVPSSSSRIDRRAHRENAFQRGYARRARPPRREARVGTANLALRHRADYETAESELELDCGSGIRTRNPPHPLRYIAADKQTSRRALAAVRQCQVDG